MKEERCRGQRPLPANQPQLFHKLTNATSRQRGVTSRWAPPGALVGGHTARELKWAPPGLSSPGGGGWGWTPPLPSGWPESSSDVLL